MRTISMPKERLKDIFLRQKIATMNQLKKVLKTTVSMTVYRKLGELNYLSSCSHSGKYYTLPEIPEFDRNGLWFHRSVLFSQYKTLSETIKNTVSKSEYGYSALELEKLLKIKPNEVLLKLVAKKMLSRTKFNGNYVYFSTLINEKIRQEQFYKKMNDESDLSRITPDVLLNEVRASIILFYCTLNEKQRRLYAGLESLKLGSKGDQVISKLLNLNMKTVAKGKKELLCNSIEVDTVRCPGGGRKKKK